MSDSVVALVTALSTIGSRRGHRGVASQRSGSIGAGVAGTTGPVRAADGRAPAARATAAPGTTSAGTLPGRETSGAGLAAMTPTTTSPADGRGGAAARRPGPAAWASPAPPAPLGPRRAGAGRAVSPGRSKLVMCVMTTRSATPGRPGAPPGSARCPGTNPAEAMHVVAGELPDFPHLPELPDRGPGADLTGRTAALLVDMPVEVTPRGWRLAEHPAATWPAPGPCSPPTWTSWRRCSMASAGRSRSNCAGRGPWPPRWSCRARSTWPSPILVRWPT